jgi:hypothetical protein
MFIKTKSPEVISETTGGETVVIHLGTGLYFSIKDAASELWASLIPGAHRDQILNARTVQNPSQPMDESIQGFLDWLVSNDLVVQTPADLGQQPLILLQSADLSFHAYDDMQDLLGLDPIHDADVEQGWPAPKAS